MSAKLGATTALKPKSCSAQTACSREEPQPKLRPVDEDRPPGLELQALLAPVVEQELAEARALDPLQELLRDDLVGVDVGAVEHLRPGPRSSCTGSISVPFRLDAAEDREPGQLEVHVDLLEPDLAQPVALRLGVAAGCRRRSRRRRSARTSSVRARVLALAARPRSCARGRTRRTGPPPGPPVSTCSQFRKMPPGSSSSNASRVELAACARRAGGGCRGARRPRRKRSPAGRPSRQPGVERSPRTISQRPALPRQALLRRGRASARRSRPARRSSSGRASSTSSAKPPSPAPRSQKRRICALAARDQAPHELLLHVEQRDQLAAVVDEAGRRRSCLLPDGARPSRRHRASRPTPGCRRSGPRSPPRRPSAG